VQVVAGRRTGMGTVLGIGSAANGAGIVIGSIAGGLLVDRYGIGAAFLLGGVIIGAGAFVFLALTRGISTRDWAANVSLEGGAIGLEASAVAP
ncbi:MAG: hypothetical protein ABI782_01535, partial [Anaerolineaceae bacterium]